jgi:hypothetical protein
MQHEGGAAANAIEAAPAGDVVSGRKERTFETPYLVLALIVAAHFAAALVMSDRPLANYVDRSWLSDTVPFFVLPVLAWIAGVTVLFARRGARSPLRALKLVVFLNRQRLLRSALLLALYVVTSRAYRAIKVALPRYAEFSFDPSWVSLDRAIFGTDPWRLTHALIGPDGTWVVDRLYILWLPVMVSMFAWTAFTRDRAFQLRSAFTHFLIWILLGNLLALAMASSGPCYYEQFFGDPTFRPLMDRLEAIGNLHALPLQNYLLASRGVESIGSGISAMPSVHVAMTMLLVLMMHSRFGWRWPTWLAVAYLAVIQVGSVHLAWHYAVDGLLSMVLVPILWFALGRLLGSPRAAR